MKHPARVLDKLDVVPKVKQVKNPAMRTTPPMPDIKTPQHQPKTRIIVRK